MSHKGPQDRSLRCWNKRYSTNREQTTDREERWLVADHTRDLTVALKGNDLKTHRRRFILHINSKQVAGVECPRGWEVVEDHLPLNRKSRIFLQFYSQTVSSEPETKVPEGVPWARMLEFFEEG